MLCGREGRRNASWRAARARCSGAPAASGGHRVTPNPTSVTIAGSLQSEAGCAGDWDPGCAATHLTYDAGDDVWQGTFTLPAGSYEYKAALNNSGTRTTACTRSSNGANIPLDRARRAGQVLLRPQDPLGHRQQELGDRGRARQLPVRARLPGRLGSRLPALVARGSRRRRHLHVRDDRAAGRLVRGARSRSTRAGTRTTARAACRAARTSRSRVPADNAKVTFSYVASTHVLTVTVAPARAGLPRRALALRPRAQGLPRHRAQHDVEGLVHGRGRRAERRLLPDGRQHQRRDAAVRRHRRLDFTDLQTRDMTYTVEALTTPAAWRARSPRRRRAASTRSTTDYVTDPTATRC